MFSKREREGYLLIDHTDSPGIENANIPIGAGRKFEAPTNTCSHCQRISVVNPDRVRQRAYCSKCDHYICDPCGIEMKVNGGVCYPFAKRADDYLERVSKMLFV